MPSTPDDELQHVLDLIVPGARAEHARTRPDVMLRPGEIASAAAARTPEFLALRRWAWETYFAGEDGYRAFACDPHPKCLNGSGPSRAPKGEDQRRRYPAAPEPGPERPGAEGAVSGQAT